MGIPSTLSSVPDQTPYIQYTASSGQTVFAYPFAITQDSDLIVVYNGVALATDSGYTVSGVGNTTGGNVTFTAGAATGDIITLYRNIPIERLTQIAQNSGFSSGAFNAEYNNIYLLLQQLQDSIDFCLQVPNTNTPAPTVALAPSAYANKYLSFDANGNPAPAVLTANGTITQQSLGALLYPETTFETTNSIPPTNLAVPSDAAGMPARYGKTYSRATDQAHFETLLSKYGAVFNGTSDDGPAISDAINAMFALGGSGAHRVIMPSGALVAKINSGFTVYCGALGIDFNGLVIDATGITSGNVITATGRGSSPYSDYSSSAPIENFNLKGSTGTSTAVMLYLNGGTPQNGPISNGFFRNFSIDGGNTGIQIASNVYILDFHSSVIQNQTQYGVEFVGGVNTGENISFHGGSISNVFNAGLTGIGLYLTSGAADVDFNLFGVSIDYCNQLVEQQGGRLSLHGCHVECGVTGSIPSIARFINVENNTGTSYTTYFRMVGGLLLIGGTVAPTNIITASKGPKTSIYLATAVENYQTTAQLVTITDATQVAVSVHETTIMNPNSTTIYGPLNQSYNGDFELGSLSGWSTNGTSYTWTADTGAPHSGTYAMKCVSTAGNTGSATQLIPVRANQRVYTDMWTSVTALSAGTFGAYAKFFQDAAGSNQVGTGVTLGLYSAATSGYVESYASGIVPAGANYMYVEVVGTTFTGTAYVDDIKVALI